jgi:undecaprenyl-diphosphatase
VHQGRHSSDPRLGLLARLGLGAGIAALVAIPFTLLLVLVESEWEPLERLDRSVADTLNSLTRGDSFLVDGLEVGADVFDPWVFRGLAVGVAVWLWIRGARRLATWAVVTITVGGILGVVLKALVERARPSFDEPVAHAGGYSFPSGHALNSMLGVAVLILIFLPVLSRVGRAIAFGVGAAVVLVTGFDRVALGVHFVSDVIAGWVVALAVVAGTTIGFEVWRRETGHPPASIAEGVDPEAADEMTVGP